jgi:hypothetical protein
MSRGTAIRIARRVAEATAEEEEAAEEEAAAAEEEELLLHAWVEFCVFLGVDLI